MGLHQHLFGHWYHYKEGTVDWPALQQSCRPIRLASRLSCTVSGAGLPARRANTLVQHSAHLPAAPEGDSWIVDLPGELGNRAHQHRHRACPAQLGDSAQDQSRRPISQRCRLPQPPAPGHHHPAATGPRCLEVPRAGLDRSSPRCGTADTAERTLRAQ